MIFSYFLQYAQYYIIFFTKLIICYNNIFGVTLWILNQIRECQH